MKMKSLLLLSALALVVAGCQSLPPGAERGPDGTMAYDVVVETTPAGAHIEANGQDIGPAPLHIKIFGDPDGTFHDFGSYQYVVRALPIATNQYAQMRVFQTGHMMAGEDHIPPVIHFDMNQPPAAYPPGGPGYPYPAYYYGAPPPYWYYGPSFRFYGGGGYYHHGYYGHGGIHRY
jgi:hypothetical protein